MKTKRDSHLILFFTAAWVTIGAGCGAVAPAAEGSSTPVAEEAVTYASETRTFDGFLAYPEDVAGAPAVIVAHDFLGLGDNTMNVARRLAEAGYVAFAVDFYGQGQRPADVEEANLMAQAVRQDVLGTRSAMQAAWTFLTARSEVDPDRIAVMGYSVGGVAALELARAGAPVSGIAGLWPILENARPEDAQVISAEVLVLVGNLDPLTPPSTVNAFESELQQAGTPVSVVRFEDVAHAFTVPAVGTDVSTGFAFDAEADAEAWRQTLDFLTRVIGG